MVDSKAGSLIDALAGDYDQADVDQAMLFLAKLQERRDYDSVVPLAEALSRVSPDHPEVRRRYAQALIETGRATAAIDMMEKLRTLLPEGHAESIEALGLIGRAHKQIYFDARVRGSDAAQAAMRESIAAYRKAYQADIARTWHGVNLLALVEHCRLLGTAYPKELKARELASQILQTLEAVPEAKRDSWWLATKAEASLALRDWGLIESSILNYTLAPTTTAFHLESTRRQFTQVWRIQDAASEGGRGKAIVDVLAAALLKRGNSMVVLPANQLNDSLPGKPDFEALLGPNSGMQYLRWWETGLRRATSVAAVCQKTAGRIGTGFLVDAADFGLASRAATLVLTNFHVVNTQGSGGGLSPADAEVRFESVPGSPAYAVSEVLWESPPEECDASLLLLDQPVRDVRPLAIARALPVLEDPPRALVYIVGHPGGRDLTISFQNNELIDHEGPKAGKPAKPDLCLVHYKTGTEGGSSGSPVFNSSWDVIALHHKGGTIGMPRLNGKAGTYGANEGVWLQSIITRVKAAMGGGANP